MIVYIQYIIILLTKTLFVPSVYDRVHTIYTSHKNNCRTKCLVLAKFSGSCFWGESDDIIIRFTYGYAGPRVMVTIIQIASTS